MKRVLTITLIVTIFLNIIMLSGCSKELQIMINGKNIVDETTIITKDNEFYIPIDTLCNSINATYEYVPYKKEITISITSGETRTTSGTTGRLTMFFEKEIVNSNGINKKADKQPFITDGTIYVPICYTMELLGYNVTKKNNLKVTITPMEILVQEKKYDGESIDYTNYKYDDRGNLIEETRDDEYSCVYEYDDKGKCIKKISNSGKTEVSFKYNESGTFAEIYEQQDNGNYRIQRFNDNGNIVYSEWYFDGKVDLTEYTFDEDGKLILEVRTGDAGNSYKATYEYNECIQTKHISYADGNEIVEVKDNNGNLLAQFSPDVLVKINYYEEENSIEIILDDASWKWTYNAQNLMAKQEYIHNGSFTTIYEYDTYGNLLKKEDSNGMIEKTYDTYGNLVEEKLINGNVHKYKYNENNRLICDESYNRSGKRESKYEYYYE